MTPREVIAKAIYEASGYPRHGALYPHVFLKEADAVIDALEGMEVTEAMWKAGYEANDEYTIDMVWSEMVGAMKHE